MPINKKDEQKISAEVIVFEMMQSMAQTHCSGTQGAPHTAPSHAM